MTNLKIIGKIETPFDEKFGVPRQSGLALKAKGRIHFNSPYDREEAFVGLNDFSHIWILFLFDQNPETDTLSVRPPRLGGNEKRGVFATRSSFRPNSIGLSLVSLKEIIIKNGKVSLEVSGVDLVNGTSIIDIKPYLPSTESIEARDSFTTLNPFKELLPPVFDEQIQNISSELRELIADVLRYDPRPAYDNATEKTYGITLKGHNIRFKIQGSCPHILEISNN